MQGMQVPSSMKQAFMMELRHGSTSLSFLLDFDGNVPFSTMTVLATMDDKVTCYRQHSSWDPECDTVFLTARF